MDISEFNTRLFNAVDSLTQKDAVDLHKNFFEKGYYNNIDISDAGDDINKIKNALKTGIQKISIEDLGLFAPQPIKDVIHLLENQETDDDFGEQELPRSTQEETQEELVREAIKIGSQRANNREEIPKDLQRRLGYIIAKLNIKYKLSRREIAKLINFEKNTVNNYANQCITAQPDLIKMWSQSIENKTIQGTEETIGKQATGRAISILKDSITLGDKIREKYAVIAAQKGYNLYSQGDLESLVIKAINLFFESESVYLGIVQLENERMRLYNIVSQLKNQNLELNELLLITNNESETE